MPEEKRPDVRPQLREYLAWYEEVLGRVESGAVVAPGEQERLTGQAFVKRAGKMRRVAFLVVSLGLIVAGCGASAETMTVTVTTTAIVVSEAVVHVYFCTTDTCAQGVTHAQIDAASRRALASPLVERVVFVSREQALEAMRKRHPEEVQALPSNPFPDKLTVVPKNPEDVEEVAALFSASPAVGIDKVDYVNP